MPILCKPAVAVPEHVITQEDTLRLCREIHARHPQLQLALRLLKNTGVKKRHLVRPVEECLVHEGLEKRNLTYEAHAKERCPAVIRHALENAGIGPKEVDALIFVSCTGFLMPSMTSWLINALGLRLSTVQIPIAQMGCAAGGAAINRAQDYCMAYPGANVLIVACEFCSLCYQPTDVGIGNLLSNGLFGDAIAAAVVRGRGGFGPRLEANGSYLIPHTEEWISFLVKPTGFHFRLDKRVPNTMEQIAPALREMAGVHGWDAGALDYYIIHAGGPKILSDLGKYLGVPAEKFAYSQATLESYGNIASAVVLDALMRAFDAGAIRDGQRGMIAGFGPGIVAEVSIGRWAAAEASESLAA
jgi:1,3,6,8-tetrahydroxynaphthalene synthase